MLTAIKKVGGNIYYCDTDSVICNINLNDYPEIKKQFQWDGDGSELGSLKNECDDYVESILKKIYKSDTKDKELNKINLSKQKKIFKQLLKKENGNFSFDSGIITGCKQYGLKKTITIEEETYEIEIVKIKGYSQKDTYDFKVGDGWVKKVNKLKYSDMEDINNGINIKQPQSQFVCPKSNFVSETDAFSINTKKVSKSFRKTYTKGKELDHGVVEPHRI